MNIRIRPVALCAAILAASPGLARAFSTCPDNSTADGYTCDQQTGAGKNGGFFRVTFPSDWDGDLVIINHGFDLNDKHIRPHETCGGNSQIACQQDSDCTTSPNPAFNFCNDIDYLGLDEVLLPMGKAVAASTYSKSGWAVFESAKDIKDVISFVKKGDHGDQLKRVIVTGFSLGGAVTGDATLKLKIDGAVPLCPAVGGGLPTWDVAQDVRLVYDFLCDNAPQADPIPYPPKFTEQPDVGVANTQDSGADAQTMAIKVNNCFGNLFPSSDPTLAAGQAQRLADFITLTRFTGNQGPDGGLNVASAMGFATLGLGDFVHDPDRLAGKRIGLNDTLDYSTIGDNPTMAAQFDAGVKRLTKGPGRGKLSKASNPNFTKGKGAKVAYPILLMAGANDWLVIPEFVNVYDTALTDASKSFTQTWIDTFGHCVFTPQEITAVFTKYFEWLGPFGGPAGTQPTKEDVHNECLANGAPEDCNFDDSFTPGLLKNRIPQRPDWPTAATH